VERFRAIFSDLPDPRDINALHDLTEILFIALLATLAGASGCAAIAEFGVAKEALLREILQLEHGIPSHDTFSRVFRMLDPAAFEQVFIRFMREFGEAAGIAAASGVVAFDGKSLRRAYEKGRARTVSSDDVPRILSAAFVYDLPFGKGNRPFRIEHAVRAAAKCRGSDQDSSK